MTTEPFILDAAGAGARLAELGDLMAACVAAGASVGYVMPFAAADGEAFFRRDVLPDVAAGRRVLFVAERDGRIAGTVQLDLATPQNQPHRVEARKLLVHPAVRRQGIARRLMEALEDEARARGRGLVTLDTRTGDAAEPLYAGLGYATVGVIPGYCVDPFDPAKLDGTTVMYKRL